jgi:hypothetical protein
VLKAAEMQAKARFGMSMLVICCLYHLQHGNYTYKASGMQAVRQFVPPNTLRYAAGQYAASIPVHVLTRNHVSAWQHSWRQCTAILPFGIVQCSKQHSTRG